MLHIDSHVTDVLGTVYVRSIRVAVKRQRSLVATSVRFAWEAVRQQYRVLVRKNSLVGDRNQVIGSIMSHLNGIASASAHFREIDVGNAL